MNNTELGIGAPEDLQDEVSAELRREFLQALYRTSAEAAVEDDLLCRSLRDSIKLSLATSYRKAIEEQNDAWLGRLIRKNIKLDL